MGLNIYHARLQPTFSILVPPTNYEQFHSEFHQKQGTTSIDSNVGQISAQMPLKLQKR